MNNRRINGEKPWIALLDIICILYFLLLSNAMWDAIK